MTITAKFSTICPCCNVRIAAGTKVEWTKGSPARHVACVGSAVSPAPRRTVRRTGASYGREDCRKYGWDGKVGSSSYYSSGQYDEDS